MSTPVVAVLNSRLHLEDMPASAMRALERICSFPNPGVNGRRGPAGPARLSMVREETIGVSVPRASFKVVQQTLESYGHSVGVVDSTTIGEELGGHELTLELRDYQVTAVNALEANAGGVVVAPCGAGKTTIGVAAIERFGREALVIVHTHDLAEQWVERLRSGLGLEAGMLGDGRNDVRPVTVALVQTLAKLDEQRRCDLGQRFGTVVVDEAHHTPARTFGEVLDWLPGRYRVGLTATPTRTDGLEQLMHASLGPTVYTVDQAELVRRGFLVVTEVWPLETRCRPETYDYVELLEALTTDPDRNRLVVDVARRCAVRGRAVLVLTSRVVHATELAARLTDEGVTAAALTGRTRKADRGKLLDALRAGELQVLVATQLADEGLDVPNLERIVMATPGRAHGRTTQRLGRLMRPLAGKAPPVLFDLVDTRHPITRSQWRARRAAYMEAGARVQGMRSLDMAVLGAARRVRRVEVTDG